MYEYEQLIIRYMENLKAQMSARPLNLGGVSGINGGAGGPPGGFIGRLPQSRVTYDLTEAATLSTPVSGASLVDNLNHIRYRIATLEGITISGGSAGISVMDEGTVVASGVTVLDFKGSNVTVTSSGTKAIVTISGGTGSFDTANLGYVELLHNNNVTLYPATTAGLSGALAAAAYGDSIFINSCDVTGDFVINSGIIVDGRGNSKINGALIAYKNSAIKNLNINRVCNISGMAYGINLTRADTNWPDNVKIENCDIFIQNTNATPGEYACIYNDGGSYVTIDSCRLTSYHHGIHVTKSTTENHYTDNYIATPYTAYAIYSSNSGECYSDGNYIAYGAYVTNDTNNIAGADIDRSNNSLFIHGMSLALQTYNSTGIGYFWLDYITGDRWYTFPDMDGTVAFGTGTENIIPLWSNAHTITDSIITQSGTASVTITGDAIVTNQFQGPKAGITEDGGFYTVLQAGEDLTRGEIVMISTTTNDQVVKNAINNDMPVGIVYATVTSGNYAKVVTNGTAYVLPETGFTATRGAIIYSSDSQAGRVDQSVGIPVNASDHWREIGHFTETGSGNGAITKAIIHFN